MLYGDYITGTYYSDDLYGSNWDDDIFGSYGDDYIDGGAGDDVLDGGAGDDYLIGGSGDDILWAGYGTDDLVGGTGRDVFAFYATGDFVIHDFNTFDDALYFDPKTTGIGDMTDLVDAIYGIDETSDGVVIDFYGGASITLIGIDWYDLNNVSVIFN